MRQTGKYEKLGSLDYFIPYPLPPKDPALNLDTHITTLYGEAMNHLGKLNEMAHRMPNITRFIKAYGH